MGGTIVIMCVNAPLASASNVIVGYSVPSGRISSEITMPRGVKPVARRVMCVPGVTW